MSVSAPFPGVQAESLAVRARLRLDHGDPSAARADVEEARSRVRGGHIGARLALVEARICHAEGRVDAARARLIEAQALAECEHLGPTSPIGSELAEVRALIGGDADPAAST